jgi:hypothetical protein
MRLMLLLLLTLLLIVLLGGDGRDEVHGAAMEGHLQYTQKLLLLLILLLIVLLGGGRHGRGAHGAPSAAAD